MSARDTCHLHPSYAAPPLCVLCIQAEKAKPALRAERVCRSDCRRPVVVELVARSASGRLWSGYACSDPAHQDGTEATMRQLGFVVERVEPVSTPDRLVLAGRS